MDRFSELYFFALENILTENKSKVYANSKNIEQIKLKGDSIMWNTNVSDGGPGYGWGGGMFGGNTGGAFLGGLAGGLIGDALFPGRGGRGGYGWGGDGCDGGGKVIQVNENDGHGHKGWTDGDWWSFKEMSDDRREQVQQTVTLQQDLFGLQRDILERHYGQISQMFGIQKDVLLGNTGLLAAIKDCCCNTQTGLLENRYLTEKEICGLSRQVSDCCCETNMNITKTGYETQLRDQANFGALMKEMAEIKCAIKDSEKDGIIRSQGAQINALELSAMEERIKFSMKPVAPVPAYIQANPYENYIPNVRCAPRCEGGFNNNWCAQ